MGCLPFHFKCQVLTCNFQCQLINHWYCLCLLLLQAFLPFSFDIILVLIRFFLLLFLVDFWPISFFGLFFDGWIYVDIFILRFWGVSTRWESMQWRKTTGFFSLRLWFFIDLTRYWSPSNFILKLFNNSNRLLISKTFFLQNLFLNLSFFPMIIRTIIIQMQLRMSLSLPICVFTIIFFFIELS